MFHHFQTHFIWGQGVSASEPKPTKMRPQVLKMEKIVRYPAQQNEDTYIELYIQHIYIVYVYDTI